MLTSFRFLLFLALLCVTHVSWAQEDPEGKQATTRAIYASTTAVEGGKAFYVGFEFKIAEGYHTYWRFPGSPGFALKVKWDLPEGWTAGDLEFPLPVTATDPNAQVFLAYEHEVMFLAKITPPAEVKGESTIAASLRWQVCRETCLVGTDTLEIKLPAGAAKPASEALFAKWQGQLPKTTPPPTQELKFAAKGKILEVRVGGLPAETKAEFFPLPPSGFSDNFDLGQKLTTATEGSDRVFGYPFSEPVTPEGWSGLLVVQKAGGPREGWMLGTPAGAPVATRGSPASSGSAPPDAKNGADPFASVQTRETESYGLLLLFGFLGGLILNLMPCVLPVIGLKILGFMQQAGNSRKRIFQLGLAFCGGVFAFFYTLALVTIPLKAANITLSVGWQFQRPELLVGMLALFLGFALSLLGVFEIELSGGVSNKLSDASQKEGLGGAFVHGFFTTLMGFSCTAPFAAAPLGAALSQPGLRAFGLFTSVAAGLCLPYFLLTLQPSWMRFLPKPGTWMIRFKQVMGFVLLGFVIFFFAAMLPRGRDAALNTLYFLLVVGIACWLLGVLHEKKWRWAMVIVVVLGGWFGLIRGAVDRPADTTEVWAPYSEKRLTEALAQGQPVFVDFTADWCVNCRFFEKTVIATEPVQAAFKEKKVLLLKGDISDEASPEGKEAMAALAKFRRSGVPFYVLFRKPNEFWFDDKLTQGTLLDELKKL